MTERTTVATTSIHLAKRLREVGLEWEPAEGDRFHIPDRGMDDHVWTLADMVIEERDDILGRRELAFNGSVEWALDSIFEHEVVWLPSEGQLRSLIGDDFIALTRDEDDGFACVIRVDGIPSTFDAETAPDAYAKALLATLT